MKEEFFSVVLKYMRLDLHNIDEAFVFFMVLIAAAMLFSTLLLNGRR